MLDLKYLTQDSISAAWEREIVAAFVRTSAISKGPDDREKFTDIVEEVYAAVKAKSKKGVESAKDKEVDSNGLPLNIQSPSHIMLGNTLDLVAYLSSVYAFKNPIFSVSDILNALHVSDAVKSKIQKDAVVGNWALEMIKWISNTTMFNYGPAELRLNTKTQVNSLRALCPFNTFCDPDVPLEKVPQEGLYAGYHELVNLASLFRELMAVPETYRTTWANKIIADINHLQYMPLGVPSSIPSYYDPVAGINKRNGIDNNGSTGMDWIAFSSTAGDHTKLKTENQTTELMYRSQHKYVRTVVYRRALPEWLNLPPTRYPKTTADTLTQLPVYKLVFLNNSILLSVEPVSEKHGLIPIAFAQLFSSTSIGTPYSFTELLRPVQEFSTKLDNARFAALRRLLSDRGIYNSEMISAEAMNDASPNAKIPANVKITDEGVPLSQAYLPIPFDGNSISGLLGFIGEVDGHAARIVGNNVQMQGGRLPGNKVASEAAREAQFAEGRFRVYAIVFQQTGLTPIKLMLRSNLGEITSALTYVDKLTGAKQAVTPQEFRDNEFEYEISDGLLPSSKFITPDAASALMTMVTQIPPLQGLYDLRTLFALLGRTLGVEDIDKIPTPDAAQMQLQARAQAGAAGQQAGVPNQAVQAAQQGVPDQPAGTASAPTQ